MSNDQEPKETADPIDTFDSMDSILADADGEQTQPQVDEGKGSPLLLPGAELDGKYTVERSLKRGGMGSLFVVTHQETGLQYVLKATQRKPNKSTTAPQRFQLEIEILSKLQHPHIVTLRDYGQNDALLYYVMDLLSGGSLFDRLANEGALPPTEALTVAMDISRAIHYAHQHNALHRDLKPENVLFARDRRPVLIDFGVALLQGEQGSRITQKGHIVGTPFYMPPERFAGNEGITAQSDVYGLGLLLYEMVVGYNPFCREKPTDAIMMIVEGKLPPLRSLLPSASEELEEICRRATTRQLSERFASAKEFTNACSAALRNILLSS